MGELPRRADVDRDGGVASSDAGNATAAENEITVTLAGSGGGTVVSTPPGLSCPGVCSEGFAAGTTVTLIATPDADSSFSGWSGDECSGKQTCVAIATGQVAVTATFTSTRKEPVLNVVTTGAGAGTVTSLPVGIDCGATCAASFAAGTTVTLTAAPSPGSTFTGWSGGCTGSSATCEVTLADAATVVATFALPRHALTVTRSGTGTGTVTSTPAGISCGATCSASFDQGTSVTLAAAPAAGSTFTGWSGSGCTGLGGCTVSMTAARAVTATFSPSGLSCSTVNDAMSCTNAVIPQINLGTISASSCRTQCQTQLKGAGVSKGCWISATDGNCYCRGGALSTGGARPGGSCN